MTLRTPTTASLPAFPQLRAVLRRAGLLAACAVPLAACDAESPEPVADFDVTPRMVELAGATCVPLMAGQSIEAGTVCVTIDATVDTSAQCGAGAVGALQVTYETTDGWTLEQTHLAVGDEPADIPTNNKGNPKIGLFPLAAEGLAGATTQSFAVPLCELGLDGADESCDPVTAHIAAHAVVSKDLGAEIQTETAWAEGTSLTDQGSWAQSFTVELECSQCNDEQPPPAKACETAFAFAQDGGGTCFIGADFDGDGLDDGISRWGWSNGPIVAGTSTQWPVYAGAGQCDTGNGTLVGYLSVSYDGATAEITFDRVGDFVLDEEHLYVGNDPLATNVQGELTVAPGQYPVVVDLDGATQTHNTVTGLSGDVFVVYHAVACSGVEGDDKGPDPLAPLGDEFDGDLGGWEIHNPGAAAVSLVGGALHLEPAPYTQWYATDEAVQVHKAVEGDFAITTSMTVTNLAGGSTVPGGPYRIGGLMLRDAAGGPNTVHMGIGSMNEPGVSAVTKSTDDGQSLIGTMPWAGETVAQMRLCRVGADVQALIRMPGQSWTILNEFVRPDLPQTLQAGPIAYAGTGDADLRVDAQWVHFRAVDDLLDCAHD